MKHHVPAPDGGCGGSRVVGVESGSWVEILAKTPFFGLAWLVVTPCTGKK